MTHALRTAIAKAPSVALAKSELDADVVVKVAKCSTSTAATATGELELSGSRGGRRGAGAKLGSGTEVRTEARVALTADWSGETRDFTSGPEMLPVEDAARVATESLLGWVESAPDDSTR